MFVSMYVYMYLFILTGSLRFTDVKSVSVMNSAQESKDSSEVTSFLAPGIKKKKKYNESFDLPSSYFSRCVVSLRRHTAAVSGPALGV